MDETDLRLDGNAVAGMLAEVFGFEMTAEWGGCAGCGATSQLGSFTGTRQARKLPEPALSV